MDYDKRRGGRACAGFLNARLRWSLYRATTTHRLPPSSTTHKLPPSSTAATVKPNPTADHLGSGGRPLQDQLSPQLPTHTRSVSFCPRATDITNNTAVDSYSATNTEVIYGSIAVDEEIDLKAANYISSVRERFRLDY